LSSIVLNPGVKEMLVDDAKDFLRSEKWYADRGIPFRRGYLLYGVPGSGKSSLIHALAGYLQLDIYVVSLSASWISDSTLTSLMGRVPARCVVLLEDLDAAFTRSANRDEEEEMNNNNGGNNGNKGGNNNGPEGPQEQPSGFSSFYGSGRRRAGRSRGGEYLSDVNTLSLSGLLNALDGVAASEGRLLFATTNHLDKLDEALRRPGRMDVWIEFKNASKWQAEALFRNFFPAADDGEDEDVDSDAAMSAEELAARRKDARDAQRRREKEVEDALKNIQVETRMFTPNSAILSDDLSSTPSPPSSVWSIASSATNLLSSASSMSLPFASSSSNTSTPSITPAPSVSASRKASSASSSGPAARPATSRAPRKKFGASNTAYIAPDPTDDVAASRHSAAPLDRKSLSVLAKTFADGVPEGEFSVAGLQGYLLKHKSNPHIAASAISEWVASERALRIKLAAEKKAREEREKVLREKRRAEFLQKREEKKKQDEKEAEMERVKAKLAEKEKEEELVKMKLKLKEKEEEALEALKKEKEGDGAKATETKSEETSEKGPKDGKGDMKDGPKPESDDEGDETEDKENWSDALP